MPPIRNSCVARGNLPANAFQTVYTVPPNTVLLLKQVLLWANGATSTDSYNCYLFSSSGIQVYTAQNVAFGTSTTIRADGWTAVNSGDQINLSCTKPASYWISGALLPFVPGF